MILNYCKKKRKKKFSVIRVTYITTNKLRYRLLIDSEVFILDTLSALKYIIFLHVHVLN